jgi:hypothetical protein
MSASSFEFVKPISHTIKISDEKARELADERRSYEMSEANRQAAVAGEPLPFPEHDAEQRRLQEEYARTRAQWRAEWKARDIIDRLGAISLDEDDEEAGEDIQDAVAEIVRLRSQVAELLPWAIEGAEAFQDDCED